MVFHQARGQLMEFLRLRSQSAALEVAVWCRPAGVLRTCGLRPPQHPPLAIEVAALARSTPGHYRPSASSTRIRAVPRPTPPVPAPEEKQRKLAASDQRFDVLDNSGDPGRGFHGQVNKNTDDTRKIEFHDHHDDAPPRLPSRGKFQTFGSSQWEMPNAIPAIHRQGRANRNP